MHRDTFLSLKSTRGLMLSTKQVSWKMLKQELQAMPSRKTSGHPTQTGHLTSIPLCVSPTTLLELQAISTVHKKTR